MKVCSILLSWKRPDNIPIIVDGLKKQKIVDDVIILHNHPSDIKIEGCKNIVSDINLGCIARHKIAEILDYDHFIFSDDDLCLKEDISEILEEHMRKYGSRSVLGAYGRKLNMENKEKRYSTGYETGNQFEYADIVKGRFHIMSRNAISILAQSKFNTEHLRSEDDIRANVSVQMHTKVPSVIMPIRGYFRDLPDQHALWKNPAHMNNRDMAIEEAIRLQWSKL